MGLDVYLKKYENFEDTVARESEFEEKSESFYSEVGEYKDLTKEQKDEIRKKCQELAQSLRLTEWGVDEENVSSIEKDHPEYPKHMFKIGYFRSSYNDSGIERILRNHELPTLSVIFNAKDEYKFRPDWEMCLIRCENTIKMFEEKNPVKAIPIYFENDSEVKSELDAVNAYSKEYKTHLGEREKMYNYQNKLGHFYFEEPLKVLGFIPGQNKYIFNERPCVFAIIDFDKEWYINALKIVRDTIKFVLEQEDKDKYYLHWSA